MKGYWALWEGAFVTIVGINSDRELAIFVQEPGKLSPTLI